MKNFSVVVAVDDRLGIGKGGLIPWHLSPDLKNFKELTTRGTVPGQRNCVIMGRRTWESLPDKARPLPGRINIVLTRHSFSVPAGVFCANDFSGALRMIDCDFVGQADQVFVIGGEEVYRTAVSNPRCAKIYMTRVDGDFQCDRFFVYDPAFYRKTGDSGTQTEGDMRFSFMVFDRI